MAPQVRLVTRYIYTAGAEIQLSGRAPYCGDTSYLTRAKLGQGARILAGLTIELVTTRSRSFR